jgi:hypothetical protein
LSTSYSWAYFPIIVLSEDGEDICGPLMA